jgi:hypothetical protein
MRLGLAVVTTLATLGTSAAAAPSGTDEPPKVSATETSFAPRLDLALLGGVVLPTCGTQDECPGSLSAAPSIRALALYQANATWAFGLAGSLARPTWRASYIGMVDGASHDVSSTLTTGFFGVTTRIVVLPGRALTPVVQAAFGTAFQSQTGTFLSCNDRVIPTAELGVGGLARVSPSLTVYGLASASDGVKLTSCAVSDGPPATPFGGWGVGFHLGAALELPLGPRARI